MSSDVEARLARVEKKLDKVIAALEPILPAAQPSARGVRVAVPIGPHDPVEGAADAKVTVVQVIELPCAPCAALAPRDGVRIVTKYVAMHGQEAVELGLLACAAHRQGKFRSAVMDPKGLLQRKDLDQARLQRDKVGCQPWLTESERAVRPLGITNVPAFFVDGLLVTAAELEATITAELALSSIPPAQPPRGRFEE